MCALAWVCGFGHGKSWPWQGFSFSSAFRFKQKRKHESKDLVRVGMNLDSLQMYCCSNLVEFPGYAGAIGATMILPEFPYGLAVLASLPNSVTKFKPMPWVRQ